MLIGHEKIRNFFSSAQSAGTLSHAYCFVGPAGVGKRTVAREVAANLLGVRLEKLDQHPDFIYIERGEDEKTGKRKKDIVIDQARGLRERLQHTSWSGGYHVVIINEAELLNAASANALLKLIEEPPKQSVFILITENEALLLPTIKSRTQLFYFSLVPIAAIAAGLIARGVPKTQAETVARLAVGRVGRAIQLLETEYFDIFQKERTRYIELASEPVYKKLTQLESVFKEIEEGERGREQLQAMLDWWVLFTRDQFLTSVRCEGLASEPTSAVLPQAQPGRLQERLDAILKTKQLLRQNVNARLAVEELCLHF